MLGPTHAQRGTADIVSTLQWRCLDGRLMSRVPKNWNIPDEEGSGLIEILLWGPSPGLEQELFV